MIILKQRVYTEINDGDDRITKALYYRNRAKDHVQNFIGDMTGKAINGINKQVQSLQPSKLPILKKYPERVEQHKRNWEEAAKNYDKTNQDLKNSRTTEAAADLARIQRSNWTKEGLKKTGKSILTGIKDGIVSATTKPGPSINNIIKTAARYPAYMTLEAINDAVATTFGVKGAMAGGFPGFTAGFSAGSLAFPGRCIGAGLETAARCFPGYKEKTEQLAKKYENSKMHSILEKGTLKNAWDKIKQPFIKNK